MSRAGRKRKHEARREGGKAVGRTINCEERTPSPQQVARTQPHRFIVGDDAVHDPRCETPIGCLAVIGAIPSREFAAAERLRGIILRYRSAIAAPGPVGSISGVGLPRARAGFEISPDDYADRVAAYRDAKAAIRNAGGQAAWPAVVAIVADGQAVPAGGFRHLMSALRVMAQSFAQDRTAQSAG